MADSIREALMGAIDDKTDTTPDAPEASATQNVETTTPPTGDSKEQVADDRESGSTPLAQTVEKTKPVAPAAVVEDTPPPASWKPEAKTLWGQIPGSARAEIARREQETARVLSTSAEARKFAQTFEQTIAPHRELFEKYQIPPIAAVKDMLGWRSTLENGTPEEKATLIGNMVRNFNIDIAKLDDYLVSSPAAAPQQAPQFDPSAVPALQPLFAIAEQIQRAKEAQVEQVIEEISSDPLFEELREDTADVLEWAAKRGREMTVKQAFEQAKVLAGHAPAQTAQISASQAGAALAAAKKAGGSVSGAPKGVQTSGSASLRDLIAAQLG